MKNSRSLMENLLVGSRVNENKLKEEMEELRKLTTETMMEKCLRKNQVVMCPKPRKRQLRQCGEHIDQKVGAEILDIFVNKASPPYYSGSPPIRSSNPLIRDARFREQKVQQNPGVGVWMEGLDIPVTQTRRVQTILTMA